MRSQGVGRLDKSRHRSASDGVDWHGKYSSSLFRRNMRKDSGPSHNPEGTRGLRSGAGPRPAFSCRAFSCQNSPAGSAVGKSRQEDGDRKMKNWALPGFLSPASSARQAASRAPLALLSFHRKRPAFQPGVRRSGTEPMNRQKLKVSCRYSQSASVEPPRPLIELST